MPRFDRTGPCGEGAITGGGRGNCIVNVDEKSLSPAREASGFAQRGRGLGRGRGNCFRAFRGAGQGSGSQLSALQAKYERLQADFEEFKTKGQQI